MFFHYLHFRLTFEFIRELGSVSMLMLALPWLCAIGYKDDVDNAKEFFKSVLVDEATCSFQPPELDMMRNVPFDDDNMFGMVNVRSLSQVIENKANVAFDTASPSDLVNKAFTEWISLNQVNQGLIDMVFE